METKIKEQFEITKFEKQILKRLKKRGGKYIVREKNKRICGFIEKPHKDTRFCIWCHNTEMFCDALLFMDLFPFIKWEDEEPTKIDDVLKNHVIVDEKGEPTCKKKLVFNIVECCRGGEIAHEIKDDNTVLFSCSNLNDCPEYAIIGRYLFDGHNYIEGLKYGMKLSEEGYTEIELEINREE